MARASRVKPARPQGAGMWVPTSPIFGPATDPFAGEVSTFVLRTADEIAITGPPAFSDRVGSRLYAEARRVYEVSKTLTDADRELAFFWADGTANGRAFDSVGGTPGPAGHWMPFGIPGRKYPSADDAAREASQSRLIAGIHYPIGIEDGAELGRRIGEKVSRRLSS